MNKYFLAFSILINMVLVMTVIGILPFLLFIFVCISIGLVWYIKNLITQIEDINEDTANISIIFENFTSHVESIYQLEMFYGDETLQALIEHSKKVLEEIDLHQQKYLLADEDVDLVEDKEDEGVNDFGEKE